MDESTRTSYLFQVGFNMIGITVTAVQAVMYVDQPRESFRIVMFLLGQQFHLYALSVPGQVMLDRSLELINDIYVSKWHEIPLKFEKTLHIMQIRCSKPCKLSAGGLYEMNIENFGTIFKTCISYFTILLSLRE
ncbi:odorant receptor 49a-like [Osmia lignaria lignaria]|uniref:odorant receptor 49a-like n=1 Tax=Osmia lignaria lignaria TaxID=1437193 RepID=UPI00402BE74F